MSTLICTLESIGRFLKITKKGVPGRFDKFIYSVCYSLEGRLDNDMEIGDMIMAWLYNKGSIMDLLIYNGAFFENLGYDDIFAANKAVKWNLPESSSKIPSFKPPFIQLPPSDEVKCVNRLLLTTKEAPALIRIYRIILVLTGYFQGLYEAERTYNNYGSEQEYTSLIFKTFGEVITTVVTVIPDSMWGTDDASARIIVNLFLAHQSNSSKKKSLSRIYGVLTTGLNWQWWSYDGSRYRVHKHMDTVNYYPDDENHEIQVHKNTVGRLAGVLTYGWIDSVRHFLQNAKEAKSMKRKVKKLTPKSKKIDQIFDQVTDTVHNIKRQYIREGKTKLSALKIKKKYFINI